MKRLTPQIDYWDSVAGAKRFSHPLRIDWLDEYLPGSKVRARVLDYGCGYGRTLAELWRAGYKNILGVDFSTAMLRRCHELLPESQLICNDGETLPLQTGSVDAVLLVAVLTCIPNSESQ